jgi:hypothetical protein
MTIACAKGRTVSILDGGIRSLFGAAFGSYFLPATLVRVTLVPDGQGGGTTDEAQESVRVQQDTVSEITRAEAGYEQSERRFLILQAGITGPVTGDCKLIFEGTTYMLSSPEQDPARSYWSVRAVPE